MENVTGPAVMDYSPIKPGIITVPDSEANGSRNSDYHEFLSCVQDLRRKARNIRTAEGITGVTGAMKSEK